LNQNDEFAPRTYTAFFAAACVLCLWVYRAALDGVFLSDDSFYVTGLARNYPLDWDFIAQAFNPSSDLKFQIMNYAPLYLVTSRVESAVFGANPFGFHVVNVVFHAFNATLLVVLMRREGIVAHWAMIGGAFFALHPANVEAVAWISQLRSILALGCAMGSILALRRFPALAALLFGAGLLFKVSALLVLPVAWTLYWCSRKGPGGGRISLSWLWVWVLLFGLYSYPQFTSFYSTGRAGGPEFASLAEHLRYIAALGARYLLMAASSAGVSAYQLPIAPQSWWGSWWLASLPIGGVLLWRIFSGIARGKREAAYWLGAAAAFAPISQFIPFYFGMADRYLYFILPGLLVATLLWREEVVSRVARRLPTLERSIALGDKTLRVAVILLLFFFASRSTERAALWKEKGSLLIESAANYPHGGPASLVRTVNALERGDIESAIPEIRNVVDTRYHEYVNLFDMPKLARYANHPEVRALHERVARLTIEGIEERGVTTQRQMRSIASAYFYLGNNTAAIAQLEQALRRGGPERQAILADLEMIRGADRARREKKRMEKLRAQGIGPPEE
jgi:hypothetical protein